MVARSSDKAAMRERILETADRLFYRQGIRAVGVDTVAAEIGISKRTLYNYFPSKDDLITAYLERRLRPPPESDRPPLEQLLGVFDRLERSFASGGFRGCPFVNAVAELKEPRHAANRIAAAFKEQRLAWYRELLARLGIKAPRKLAVQLQILVDGAIAAMIVRGDTAAARAARDAGRVLLASADARRMPARPNRSDALRRKLEDVGVTEKDVAGAVSWARGTRRKAD